jgi:general secretion pathway protein E
VRPKRGLTFATGLRAIVRQDPDIIMVGEIRDRETADIAIRSALTGHLVFSSLHTNDAPGAITRLLDMGVEPFLVASSLQGALGQRLVRRLCRHCRRPVLPDPLLARQFGVSALPENIWEAARDGCAECHGHGYFGRIGIFELLTMDEQLHEMVLHASSSTEIRRAAVGRMPSMREDGWEKIQAGITAATEVLQATQYESNGNGG